MEKSRLRSAAAPGDVPVGADRSRELLLAGNSTVRLQQPGGKADHQQDKQQHRQADTHGQGSYGTFRGALVLHQEEQAAEQTADDGKQKQNDDNFCDHNG
jgi:hypothetical protein